MSEQLPDNDEQWREILTEEEYNILREAGTEPKFSGDLLESTARERSPARGAGRRCSPVT